MSNPMHTPMNTPMNHAPILAARNLSKTFGKGATAVAVLADIDWQISPGETVAIVGSSGSGKSTLLQMLGGLDTPSTGTITLADQPFSTMGEAARGKLRNKMLGFVYQFHHLLPELSARENVALPLLIRRTPAKQAYAEADALLDAVGLAHRLQHKPGMLSGGERQRTAIARALVTRPAVLLADEPTGNLDHANAEAVFDLLLNLNTQLGTALILVTHDLQLAARMKRVVSLRDGRLIDN